MGAKIAKFYLNDNFCAPLIYAQPEVCCITCYRSLIFLVYFILLIVFLIVSYFINNVIAYLILQNI